MIETCRQYVDRRLSEGWKVVSLRGNYLILSTPDGNMLRTVDLRNDVETLRPSAAGSQTQIDSQYPLTGSHYDKVDEESPDEDSTRVYTSVATTFQRDLYNLPASSIPDGATINFIKVYFRCKAFGEAGFGYASIRSNSTITDGAIKGLTTGYVTYSEQWNTNPAGGDWEVADLADLQIGVKLYGYSGATVNCTQVYVEVDYSAVTTAYKDIATRFRLRVQAFKDTATRFKLAIQGYKDTATRFLLTVGVQAYKDIATRFKLWAQDYQDIATRFKLFAQGYQDIATRFILTALNYQDIATRFKLIVQAYEDIVTRFQLTVQAYRDTVTRFRLIVQNYWDAVTRFRLWVEAYQDATTRFILNVLNYQDIAARFKLTVRVYRDITTRFKLIAQRYTNIAARFKLSIQTYQDVSTRFFLYQPTWEEIQIQQAVEALKAEIAGLELEPVAHFRI